MKRLLLLPNSHGWSRDSSNDDVLATQYRLQGGVQAINLISMDFAPVLVFIWVPFCWALAGPIG